MAVDVMIVDDDKGLRQVLAAFVEEIGFTAGQAGSGQEALKLCREMGPRLVLLDVKLPGLDGLQVMRQLREEEISCRVVVMSAYSETATVVKAMNLGAETFLTKPTPLPELRALIEKLLKDSVEEVQEVPGELEEVVGRSAAMQQVYRTIRRVASTRATVLIRGESGTGKELIARAIHQLGAVAGKPFVSVDCANIPENLMESELFGHERGAFTDARTQKKGLLESAGGGTILLDEIGLMPVELQAKLLHVLETRSCRRVGGTEEIEVEARFLAATNEDLEEAVKQGRFREDLYYRLNVVPVDMPPLRERDEDVLLIAEHYLGLYCKMHDIPPKRLHKNARALVQAYPWPGNVRELRNVLERAVLMLDGEVIHAEDLVIDRRSNRPPPIAPGLNIAADGKISIVFPPQGLDLERVEWEIIQSALEYTGGNVTKAASLLHLSRDTLRYRIGKYDLEEKTE